MNRRINVTQPSMPDLFEFQDALRELWSTKVLTNNGPKVQELEKRLCEYLDVENLVLYSSGTTAIMGTLFSLEKKGEIITTPFTFAATSNSVELCGSNAIFSDIDYETLNLAPSLLERRINSSTLAVMPVACYGNTSGFMEIREICDENKLIMIADCSHSFGVRDVYNPLSVADYSILSFHATKVFSTIEGGAVICKSEENAERLREMRSFGIVSQDEIKNIGFNAKMSEIHAIFGLMSLEKIDQSLAKRKAIEDTYIKRLKKHNGIRFQKTPDSFVSNGAYFPIILEESDQGLRDKLCVFLEQRNVFARKYFYPLSSQVSSKKGEWTERLPVALKLSKTILCLPIFDDLQELEVEYICDAIDEFFMRGY